MGDSQFDCQFWKEAEATKLRMPLFVNAYPDQQPTGPIAVVLLVPWRTVRCLVVVRYVAYLARSLVA